MKSFLSNIKKLFYCWILTWRSFLTWRVNCVVDITENKSVSLCKCNAGVSSAEVQRKLREWQVRQETCPRAKRRRKMWPRGLHGHPGNYIKQGRFPPLERRVENEENWQKGYLVVTLGAGLPPDYPELITREKPDLYQTRESREGRKKLRWFSHLRCPIPGLRK